MDLMTLLAGLGGALALLVAWLLYRRWRTLSLRWPAGLHHNGITSRCATYLRAHGWTIHGQPYIPRMNATKNGFTVRIFCIGQEGVIASTTFYDIRIHNLQHGGDKIRQSIVVTTQEVNYLQRGQAETEGVLLLHYSDLDKLEDVVGVPQAPRKGRKGEKGKARPAETKARQKA